MRTRSIIHFVFIDCVWSHDVPRWRPGRGKRDAGRSVEVCGSLAFGDVEFVEEVLLLFGRAVVRAVVGPDEFLV